MSKELFAKMDALKERCIPEQGFNVVAVDTFSIPGEPEGIFVVANYATQEEADKAAQAHQQKNPYELAYVYPARNQQGEKSPVPEKQPVQGSVQKSRLQKFHDFTAPIVQADTETYERVKRVLIKRGHKARDFAKNGTLYGKSTNELLDMILEDQGK